MKNDNNEVIEKLKEFIQKAKEISSRYDDSLSKKEKEELAASIVGAIFTAPENIEEKEEIYSIFSVIDKIEFLSDNLEWSNSIDINKDWQELIGYINQLEKQVNNPKPSNRPQPSQD